MKNFQIFIAKSQRDVFEETCKTMSLKCKPVSKTLMEVEHISGNSIHTTVIFELGRNFEFNNLK